MGNQWGLKQSQGSRNVQKEEKGLVNVNRLSGFVNWCSSKLGSCPSTKTGGKGPSFRN